MLGIEFQGHSIIFEAFEINPIMIRIDNVKSRAFWTLQGVSQVSYVCCCTKPKKRYRILIKKLHFMIKESETQRNKLKEEYDELKI